MPARVVRARLREGFVGRDWWLSARIDEWLAESARQEMAIIGEPGIGKSAIVAWLAGCAFIASRAGLRQGCPHGQDTRPLPGRVRVRAEQPAVARGSHRQ